MKVAMEINVLHFHGPVPQCSYNDKTS